MLRVADSERRLRAAAYQLSKLATEDRTLILDELDASERERLTRLLHEMVGAETLHGQTGTHASEVRTTVPRPPSAAFEILRDAIAALPDWLAARAVAGLVPAEQLRLLSGIEGARAKWIGEIQRDAKPITLRAHQALIEAIKSARAFGATTGPRFHSGQPDAKDNVVVQPVVLKQESVRVAAVVQIGGRPIRPSEPEPSLPDFPAAAAASGAAREAEIEALRREVEDLQQALRDATANVEVAAQAAYEKGAAEGRRLAHVAAEADRSKLESALAAAAEKAAGAFEAKFDKLEQLALEAALIAVERVLGANSDRAAIVEQIVLEQLRSLRGTTVLSLTVSAADFSDAVPLAAAIDQRKFSRCEVKLSPQLETGGCQFELSAGSLDAGVSTQIEALREVLRGESR